MCEEIKVAPYSFLKSGKFKLASLNSIGSIFQYQITLRLKKTTNHFYQMMNLVCVINFFHISSSLRAGSPRAE